MPPFIRSLISRSYSSALLGAIWYGGHLVRWPRPLVLAGLVVAALTLALGAYLLVWWTHDVGTEIAWVGHVLRLVVWLSLLALVVVWMIRAPQVGVLGGAFLAYVACTAWREQVDRAWSWVRREHRAPQAWTAAPPVARPYTNAQVSSVSP